MKKIFFFLWCINKVILATPCSWKFGKPCLASKASRGFFLLLPTVCQKTGLAKEPSILMGLENIQERKGKRHSLPDVCFLVFILAQYFVCTWQTHKSPQSTLTSALFSARIAKPQVQLLTGILHAAQLAYMSALNHVEPCSGTNVPFPSEPGHRSTLTGRVTLQLTLRLDGSNVNSSDNLQSHQIEQTLNSWHTRNTHKHLTVVSKKPLLLEFLYQRARWLWISRHTSSCIPYKINIYQHFCMELDVLQLKNWKKKKICSKESCPDSRGACIWNSKQQRKTPLCCKAGTSLSTN